MKEQTIQLEKLSITVTEVSPEEADAKSDLYLVTLAKIDGVWTAEAELLAEPTTKAGRQFEVLWERQEVDKLERFASRQSGEAFDVLVLYYQRQNAILKRHAARHPMSRRGDRSR